MEKKQGPYLVNTAAVGETNTPIKYARTKDGKINLAAYKGKKGQIIENNLNINVKILDARTRYGHLDLKVTPLAGRGEVWVERKNIQIDNDPANQGTKVAAKPRVKTERHLDGDTDRVNTMSAEELRGLVATLVNGKMQQKV